MRVGFDIGPITPAPTGVGNYCYYLLKHLLADYGDVDFVGFASGRRRPALQELDGRLYYRYMPVPTRALYRAWLRWGRPRVDRLLGGVDVYHATNYFLPPVQAARRVVTIHDLAFLVSPELASPRIVGPYSKHMARFAGEADHILTYSEATKADVVEYLEVSPDKITVAPMAVDDGFALVPREEAARRVKETYGIDTPFLLFVSTLEPRKNVPTLLRAFAKITRYYPHRLVLIGSVGWNADDIFRTLDKLNLGDRVVRPGFVPHRELPIFYCAADAFVFPTLYEGFGLPLLEALTCGCPVVASDNSSVPEVTGDAALRSPAHDADAIAEDISRVLSNEALREEMVRRGLAHARRYSWKACARATYNVYRSLAS